MKTASSSTRRRPWLAALRGALFALAAGFVVTGVGATLDSPAYAQSAAPAASTAPAPAAEAAPAAAAPAAGKIKAPEVTVNKGDTAWMLISTALVLVMTIPGLALFYGGLVRTKNMGATLMQVSTVAIIGMIMWALFGYSLAFTDGGKWNAVIGGTTRFFLNDAGTDLSDNNAATFSTGVYIPELVYVLFQMTFAAITAALVVGGIAERVKFVGICIFAVVWPLLVYYPVAHMVWFWPGPDAIATHASDPVAGSGFLFGKGALDFAGGSVVHINSGIAALMGALVVGRRVGYKKEAMPPHNLVWTYCGAGLLWFGWFGFNAGSNLESNYYAVLAMANTFLATAAAGFSWCLTEWIFKGKPSFLGLSSGLVAGLVAVTPASGFAGPMGAIVLGLVVSPVCVFFCSFVKNMLGYDDALDVFGVHCIGGIIGALGTGILVNPALGGAGVVDYVNCSKDGAVLATCPVAPYDLVAQMTSQATDILVTLAWSGSVSLVIWLLLRVLGLLRVSQDTEVEGLDINEHGEAAYHY